MTFLAFLFILISLVTFVAAQLILKRAMDFSATGGMRNSYFMSRVAIGVVLMTVSFFLTLGLLQRFDLSYLYPFQGLSVIFITVLAAVVLKEKIGVRLAIGALLITITEIDWSAFSGAPPKTDRNSARRAGLGDSAYTHRCCTYSSRAGSASATWRCTRS